MQKIITNYTLVDVNGEPLKGATPFALPTGTISMLDVRNELKSSGAISLNDTAVRNLAGKSSGIISLNDLRGKSASTDYYYLALRAGFRDNGDWFDWNAGASSNPAGSPCGNITYINIEDFGGGEIYVQINPSVTTSLTSGRLVPFTIEATTSSGSVIVRIGSFNLEYDSYGKYFKGWLYGSTGQTFIDNFYTQLFNSGNHAYKITLKL